MWGLNGSSQLNVRTLKQVSEGRGKGPGTPIRKRYEEAVKQHQERMAVVLARSTQGGDGGGDTVKVVQSEDGNISIEDHREMGILVRVNQTDRMHPILAKGLQGRKERTYRGDALPLAIESAIRAYKTNVLQSVAGVGYRGFQVRKHEEARRAGERTRDIEAAEQREAAAGSPPMSLTAHEEAVLSHEGIRDYINLDDIHQTDQKLFNIIERALHRKLEDDYRWEYPDIPVEDEYLDLKSITTAKIDGIINDLRAGGPAAARARHMVMERREREYEENAASSAIKDKWHEMPTQRAEDGDFAQRKKNLKLALHSRHEIGDGSRGGLRMLSYERAQEAGYYKGIEMDEGEYERIQEKTLRVIQESCPSARVDENGYVHTKFDDKRLPTTEGEGLIHALCRKDSGSTVGIVPTRPGVNPSPEFNESANIIAFDAERLPEGVGRLSVDPTGEEPGLFSADLREDAGIMFMHECVHALRFRTGLTPGADLSSKAPGPKERSEPTLVDELRFDSPEECEKLVASWIEEVRREGERQNDGTDKGAARGGALDEIIKGMERDNVEITQLFGAGKASEAQSKVEDLRARLTSPATEIGGKLSNCHFERIPMVKKHVSRAEPGEARNQFVEERLAVGYAVDEEYRRLRDSGSTRQYLPDPIALCPYSENSIRWELGRGHAVTYDVVKHGVAGGVKRLETKIYGSSQGKEKRPTSPNSPNSPTSPTRAGEGRGKKM